MAPNDLVTLSAVELRRRIGTKELSPVELLDACIEQIETYNPAVNCICATDFGRAREQQSGTKRQCWQGRSWVCCTVCHAE